MWNTRENVVVLDFLAVNNFDFTRKIIKKVLGEKLMKMLEFYQNWIYTVLGDLLCIVLKNLLGRRSSSASASMPHSGHDFLVSSQNTGSWQGRRFMWPVTNWPKQVPRQLGINLWHFPTDHEARLKTTKRRLLLMIIMKKNNSIAKLLLGGVNHLFHALAASRCHCCTLFEIFIFCPKIQLWFPEKKLSNCLWWKLVKMPRFWTF